jgi:formate hydrogenlyase transcriptional activator
MQCRDLVARAQEYLADELPAGERAALQAHVESCHSCTDYLATYRATVGLAREAFAHDPVEDPPEALISAILAASVGPKRSPSLVLVPDAEQAVLRLRLLDATVGTTGRELLGVLARALGLAFGVSHAFVAELVEPGNGAGRRARMLAWQGDGLEDGEYELARTPCEQVVRRGSHHEPRGVQPAFPGDPRLARIGVESYLGVAFVDGEGGTLGHIGLLDTKSMPEPARMLATLEWLAPRVSAELLHARAEAALRHSEQQFRGLFEEAPIAYVYEETSTRFVSANRAFMKLLGLRPEDVPGTYGRTLLAPTSETQGRVDEAFADIEQGKEPGQLELELRRKDDGQPVWVQFWSRPEPDGKHTRTMIIDITDRVLAERERNRLRAQNTYLREELEAGHPGFEEIIGRSPALAEALAKVEQVAPTDATVLVLGETGTGKELIARAVHRRSRRSQGPLIKLNCGALPTGLIESELFGHEKGAFTGALERRLGRFALADGGAIFLDEIGDVPAEVQVRLLRVLQEYEFEPVGSAKSMKVDVRVIAATNRDLSQAVATGAFRSDLFYRLNVFPIEVPPLRERKTDIGLLAQYFAEKYATRFGKHFEGIDKGTLERLAAYPWPGNIRELENVIERAVILSTGGVLEVAPSVLGIRPGAAPPVVDERHQIMRALAEARGVIEGERGAAKALGLHPNTLRSRMKKLGIERPRG